MMKRRPKDSPSFCYISLCVAFLILGVAFQAPAQCLDKMIDLKSSQWRNSKTVANTALLKKHTVPISKITIHYTGAKKNPKALIETKLRNLFEFSTKEKTKFKKRLWGDVPYNYYIDMNGTAAEGRDASFQPDTNTNYSPNGHVTIVVEGSDEDDLSSMQKTKLFGMIKALQNRHGLSTSALGIHKHFANTSCPGKAIESAVQEYKASEAHYQPIADACTETAKSSGAHEPVVTRPAPATHR